jgi:hypothetical protein
MTTRTTSREVLIRAQNCHRDGNLDEAERLYHQIFNKDINNLDLILQIAQINHQKGNHGLAIILYQKVIENHPDIAAVWNNLGICLKLESMDDSAEFCFKKAIELEPNNPDFPANISAIYVNQGKPDIILEWADKAIEIGPNDAPGVVQARWHKALALLEKKDFSGWEFHEARLEEGAGCKVAHRNYSKDGVTPWWDGKSKGLVVLHGEQGIGDEIMFSSCIPDALNSGAEFVFECTPRLEGLIKRSFPGVSVVGTNNLHGEDWNKGEKVDFKLGIGSLPRFYRPTPESCPGEPFLIPDTVKVEHYKQRLSELGDKPKIGIAWMGGVLKTRVELRSLFLQQLKPILEQDFDFISLQYTSNAESEIEAFEKETGIKIHHWPEAAKGIDMDDQAALISNLDLVITVCQTAVHVSGGLGIPCWVFTPSRPSWRYAIEGDIPWYKSVKLYRQKGDDWDSVINEVSSELSRKDFKRVSKAKSKAA